MRKQKFLTVALSLLLVCSQVNPVLAAKDAGSTSKAATQTTSKLAETPPMGWSSWNEFGRDVTAQDIMNAADAISVNGMKEAGYEYVNVDDCWMSDSRDANGHIIISSTFANLKGVAPEDTMKVLGDYIHSKGLKFGVYVSNGTNTCQGHVSSLLHEETDAQDFEEWGVDFLKYDYCNNNLISTYTPNIDKISVNRTSYEAEDAVLGGDAKVSSLETGSAKVVTSIGNTVVSHSDGAGMGAKSIVDSYTSGTLEFTQVKVAKAGNYTVSISYTNSDYNKRLANIYVNGSETPVKVYFPGIKGDNSTIQTVTVTLKLKVGINTIKFTNPLISVRDRNQEQYSWMGKALRKYAPDVVYYLCDWGTGEPWTWDEQYAQMWRTTFDISDTWESMIGIADQNTALANYSGSGRWNDPDSLEVGNGGMTDTEYTSHFSLWSIMAAPLIAGNNLTAMTETTKAILTNSEVIAVDQDSLGIQGTVLSTDANGNQIYTKKLANGDIAVLFLNRGTDTVTMSTSATKIGLKKSKTYTVRDLWEHKSYTSAGNITVTIPSHGCAMFRVSKTGKAYQPFVNIALTTNTTLAVPDRTYNLSNKITNLGQNISNVKVTLSIPSGWALNGTSDSSITTTTSDIKTNGSNDDLVWSYKIPSDAKAGYYNITEKITFNYGKSKGIITKTLQVLVPDIVSPDISYLSDAVWYYGKNGSNMMGSVAFQIDKSSSGSAITIGGVKYAKGLGVFATSDIKYCLAGKFSSFSMTVGMDDTAKFSGPWGGDPMLGSVSFKILGDGKVLFDSGKMEQGMAGKAVTVDVTGVTTLELVTTSSSDMNMADYADWADPKLTSK